MFSTARQMNPIHLFTSYFFNTYFNIILPSTPTFLSGLFSSGFPSKNFACTSYFPHMCYIPCLSHSYWFDNSANVWWEVRLKRPLTLQFPPVFCYVVPLRPKRLPWHLVPETPRPKFFSWQNFTRTQINTNIAILCPLISISSDSKWDNRRFWSKW
jgi:hypothetical protein